MIGDVNMKTLCKYLGLPYLGEESINARISTFAPQLVRDAREDPDSDELLDEQRDRDVPELFED